MKHLVLFAILFCPSLAWSTEILRTVETEKPQEQTEASVYDVRIEQIERDLRFRLNLIEKNRADLLLRSRNRESTNKSEAQYRTFLRTARALLYRIEDKEKIDITQAVRLVSLLELVRRDYGNKNSAHWEEFFDEEWK